VDYAIDPTLSFKSITAYRSNKSYAPIDFDSLNTPLFEAPAIYTDRQASQFSSPTPARAGRVWRACST
jgi:iron complex outermembrane receptor protein